MLSPIISESNICLRRQNTFCNTRTVYALNANRLAQRTAKQHRCSIYSVKKSAPMSGYCSLLQCDPPETLIMFSPRFSNILRQPANSNGYDRQWDICKRYDLFYHSSPVLHANGASVLLPSSRQFIRHSLRMLQGLALQPGQCKYNSKSPSVK